MHNPEHHLSEMHVHSSHVSHSHHDHTSHTFYDEIICHFPYAVFSVAFSIAVLSILTYISMAVHDKTIVQKSSHVLFHSFHFMHIVFAATGTLVTFFRFSKNIIKGLLIGIISPAIFCMLSDVVLPYLGGRLLGFPMTFHICFVSEIRNVLPFLIVGIINGWLMSLHKSDKQGSYSLFSHVTHITVSSLASMFYLVSHGFTGWHHHVGVIFLLLIFAVVIPCTLSDVVVPFFVAKADRK